MSFFNSFISEILGASTIRFYQLLFFIFSLCLAGLLSYLLSFIYIKYGNSLSNRKTFGKNFVLLATATMFIIFVVKSSLALSLGLVGALSIVRFRSAIKEPEELMYLFFNIAIGLGCGAGQTVITIIAFSLIVLFIFINNKIKGYSLGHSLYLLISCEKNGQVNLQDIIAVLEKHSATLKLKRNDESQDFFEASFYIDFDNYKKLEEAKEQLYLFDKSIKLTFMDTSRDY